MNDLETKLLAQLQGLISAVENNGAEQSLSVLCREVDLAKALIAESQATQRQAQQPSADGWIAWAGNPGIPVKYGTRVDVEYRDGERVYGIPAGAIPNGPNSRRAIDWAHYDLDEDIVAYRVVGAPDSKPSTLGG